MSDAAHILLADRHRLFGEGVKAILERVGGFEVTCVSSLEEATARAEAAGSHALALLDHLLPGMEGVLGLRRVMQAGDRLPVALLAGRIAPPVAETALQAGAAGVVLKTNGSDALLFGLRLMLAGERYVPTELAAEGTEPRPGAAGGLTGRESQILALLVTGLSNKEIARKLDIGPVTVAMHLTSVFRKLRVASRTQAIAIALQRREGGGGPPAT